MKQDTKRIYYHGTSADHLPDILENGLRCDTDKLWSCSCDEVYLWCVEELAKANGDEDEEYEFKKERAFNQARESGEIACAISNDCRIIVLEIELDEDEVQLDTSCENMSTSGAVTINRDIELHEIKSIKISNDLLIIKGYFISHMIDREYSNIEFNRTELIIGNVFKNEYCELIDEMESIIKWEEVQIPQYE